jgi:pantoate--beta-alanine ligase
MFVGFLPNYLMVFYTHKKLKDFLKTNFSGDQTIGFVPTMGALHDGHLALMRRASNENQILVVSIFVNPTQFNNSQDLAKYPRNLQQDQEFITNELGKENVVIYAPSVQDVYGDQAQSNAYDFDGLENVMEGAHRPGHFDGVGTIVEFLFKTIEPDRAYFGEKDFQQLQIIKKLVENKNLDVEIVGCPIHREPSGLAMSSRNGRLSKNGFEQAAHIYQTLKKAAAFFEEHTIKETITFVENSIDDVPAFDLEYFTIASEQTLQPVVIKQPHQRYRGFIVVHVEGVRLIDNIPLSIVE